MLNMLRTCGLPRGPNMRQALWLRAGCLAEVLGAGRHLDVVSQDRLVGIPAL
jgi:hypothetical protein